MIFIMDKNIGSIVFHYTQKLIQFGNKHICTPADKQMQFLIGVFKNCQSCKNITCIIVHNKSCQQKSVTLIKNERLSVDLLLHRNIKFVAGSCCNTLFLKHLQTLNHE